MNLNNWAERMTEDFYDLWKSKYSIWLHGFKIFYSQPVVNPKLLIISYQPGGNETNFLEEDKYRFEKRDFKIIGNAYTDTRHKMSLEVQRLFSFDNGMDLLRESVILPIIFWRSPDAKIWNRNENKREMEEESDKRVVEVIEKLRPKKIFVIGFSTYDKLKSIFDKITHEQVSFRKSGKGRLVVTSEFEDVKILVTAHLTESRISTVDKNTLKNIFMKWSTS